MNPPSSHRRALDEAAARELVLLQAFDGAGSPLWTPEDRAWATRLAQETVGPAASDGQFLTERAHHAMQRLLPRDGAVRRWAARRAWRPASVPLAVVLGFVLGLLADSLGGTTIVNLLAPPVWAVVAWNLVVYLGLAVTAARPAPSPGRPAGLLRRTLLGLARGVTGGPEPLRTAAQAWTRVSAPLALARVALLLHVAAAALAAGLIASLYLRGLVFDIRAGWQSTFLDAPVVHALLSTLLAPASALSGVPVPDVAAIEALRVTPPAQPTATAAPWIHLYATTLLWAVILPRLLLALAAGAQAWRRARHFPLVLDEPYFRQLLQRRRGGSGGVLVQPHAAAPSAQAAIGLRARLAATLGDDVQLHFVPPTAFGDEDAAGAAVPAAGPGAAPALLRIALVDLAATPEADTHGRFVRALQQAAPGARVLLVADESAFRRRFAGLPERLAQRRAAWQALAQEAGVALVCDELDQPGDAGAAAWREALSA